MPKTLQTLFLVCLLAGDAGLVAAAEFTTQTGLAQDTVYFRSTARLEFIEGKTTSISGSIRFDPDRPDTTTGRFRVDLRELATGIELRDEHMRDRHLETDEYPFAYFELDGLHELAGPLREGETYEATADGRFYIHGVGRETDVNVSFGLHGGDGALRRASVRASFQIQLDDYKINRPKALFMKLAETVEVEVVLSLDQTAVAPVIDLPDW